MFFRIKHVVAAIKTRFFLKFFFKKCGTSVTIIKPILLTYRNICIGNHILIRNNARIEAVTKYLNDSFNPEVIISDNVTIEQNLHLTCAKRITIGENTSIAANVTLSDINHRYLDINITPDKQPIEVSEVVIGADCKIYNNAVILPGTVLGKHCVVGANSVVKGQIYQDYCILVGAPAKVIKRYSFKQNRWLKTDSEGNFLQI